MSLKIVRNDITKMTTEAIVNTANKNAVVGTGCDMAVYNAAGYESLLQYRMDNIGYVPEGDVFITPAFDLQSKYIIHAVSPAFINGNDGEEEKLRSCYKKSLQLAKEHDIKSIAFPLISTGGLGYPKEEGFRIAIDEIGAFLLKNDMLIYLVVFDNKSVSCGTKLFPDLETYIDTHYVESKLNEEYDSSFLPQDSVGNNHKSIIERFRSRCIPKSKGDYSEIDADMMPMRVCESAKPADEEQCIFGEKHESILEDRINHISDSFSEYLMYLIRQKNMDNADVYKRALVDKKVFSKIKNNPDYHPKKLTVLCLCVGAKLNLDESRDLLARAGYALSPCDKMDIIFSYFIENKIYDMIELDIQLEEHGIPCIIA